ncbi:hypothetical protein [Hymenobacter terricola]|uniref:hypothetical protein n=1 Tax=Hymenobacter terricola TaxID=2819236 RepID=UPI001B30B011|nr:hypothetical protein [Hymenobacter terricola]
MNWFTKTFSSSIGRKITGLRACFSARSRFHQPADADSRWGDTFNIRAEFMATNPLIRAREVVLMLALLWRTYQA